MKKITFPLLSWKSFGTNAPAILLKIVFLVSLIAASHSAGARDEPLCSPDLFPPKRIKCYLDAALRNHNPAICLSADDPVRFQCISIYAERTGEEKACELLAGTDPNPQTLRDTCVVGVAIAASDPEICGHAESQHLIDACYAQFVLEKNADRVLCDRIKNIVLRQACADK